MSNRVIIPKFGSVLSQYLTPVYLGSYRCWYRIISVDISGLHGGLFMHLLVPDIYSYENSTTCCCGGMPDAADRRGE